jgi:peptidoglycan/LPS O-acetylase OafA/YrhL
MSALGHQSVVVFFVLSGFFVAGSIATAIGENRWSWGKYAVQRLTRLLVVLLPALILTGLWDSLGCWLGGGKGYDGSFYRCVGTGPAPEFPVHRDMTTLLGNVAFLETIFCPAYGSNLPLWSLANEFWYYLLFPLVYVPIAARSRIRTKVAFGVAALLLVLVLRRQLFFGEHSQLRGHGIWLLGGGIWLLGYFSYLGLKVSWLRTRAASPVLFLLASTVFLFTLWQSTGHSEDSPKTDLALAVSFSLMVPFLASKQVVYEPYRRLSEGLSDISYTLYLTHFPLLAFFFFTFRLPKMHPPSLVGYLVFLAVLSAALLYAVGVWYLFERRTDQVRRKVNEIILSLRTRGRALKPSV